MLVSFQGCCRSKTLQFSKGRKTRLEMNENVSLHLSGPSNELCMLCSTTAETLHSPNTEGGYLVLVTSFGTSLCCSEQTIQRWPPVPTLITSRPQLKFVALNVSLRANFLVNLHQCDRNYELTEAICREDLFEGAVGVFSFTHAPGDNIVWWGLFCGDCSLPLEGDQDVLTLMPPHPCPVNLVSGLQLLLPPCG